MNAITYSYEVVSVDTEARVMEVVYTSEGRQSYRIGCRLPFDGETLDQVIAMYAPVQFWRQQETPILTVEVGVSGQKTDGAPPPPPTPEETLAMFTAAIDGHVEAVARSRKYNGAAHLASYAASTVAQWASEAATFVAWRDQVWLTALELLARVQAGEAEPPTAPAEFIATLPSPAWPQPE